MERLLLPPGSGRTLRTVMVVGSSSHQDGYVSGITGKSEFILRPESANAYDSLAVQVLRDDDHLVGYLSRWQAGKYQPLIRQIMSRGYEPWSAGEITHSVAMLVDGEEIRRYGARLHLAYYVELAEWIEGLTDQYS